MTSWKLASPDHQKRFALQDAPAVQSLSEKHRPATLADMVGQGEVVFRLESFLEAPYSCAMLFEGPTGVGKTTAALALAAELGAVEYGGLDMIQSGMQDAESVETVLKNLRYTPMLGSGWKVVIVEEADYQSPKASQLWLSALESLPGRSVVIFTTNNVGKFADRFLDRCERFTFAADPSFNAPDAQALADRIWLAELGRTDGPNVCDLKGIVDGNGQLSYRRVVRALEPMIASARITPKPEPVIILEPIPSPLEVEPVAEPDPIKETPALRVKRKYTRKPKVQHAPVVKTKGTRRERIVKILDRLTLRTEEFGKTLCKVEVSIESTKSDREETSMEDVRKLARLTRKLHTQYAKQFAWERRNRITWERHSALLVVLQSIDNPEPTPDPTPPSPVFLESTPAPSFDPLAVYVADEYATTTIVVFHGHVEPFTTFDTSHEPHEVITMSTDECPISDVEEFQFPRDERSLIPASIREISRAVNRLYENDPVAPLVARAIDKLADLFEAHGELKTLGDLSTIVDFLQIPMHLIAPVNPEDYAPPSPVFLEGEPIEEGFTLLEDDDVPACGIPQGMATKLFENSLDLAIGATIVQCAKCIRDLVQRGWTKAYALIHVEESSVLGPKSWERVLAMVADIPGDDAPPDDGPEEEPAKTCDECNGSGEVYNRMVKGYITCNSCYGRGTD